MIFVIIIISILSAIAWSKFFNAQLEADLLEMTTLYKKVLRSAPALYSGLTGTGTKKPEDIRITDLVKIQRKMCPNDRAKMKKCWLRRTRPEFDYLYYYLDPNNWMFFRYTYAGDEKGRMRIKFSIRTSDESVLQRLQKKLGLTFKKDPRDYRNKIADIGIQLATGKNL
jgi:type II secretory pathway pseudopilin PulG